MSDYDDYMDCVSGSFTSRNDDSEWARESDWRSFESFREKGTIWTLDKSLSNVWFTRPEYKYYKSLLSGISSKMDRFLQVYKHPDKYEQSFNKIYNEIIGKGLEDLYNRTVKNVLNNIYEALDSLEKRLLDSNNDEVDEGLKNKLTTYKAQIDNYKAWLEDSLLKDLQSTNDKLIKFNDKLLEAYYDISEENKRLSLIDSIRFRFENLMFLVFFINWIACNLYKVRLAFYEDDWLTQLKLPDDSSELLLDILKEQDVLEEFNSVSYEATSSVLLISTFQLPTLAFISSVDNYRAELKKILDKNRKICSGNIYKHLEFLASDELKEYFTLQHIFYPFSATTYKLKNIYEKTVPTNPLFVKGFRFSFDNHLELIEMLSWDYEITKSKFNLTEEDEEVELKLSTDTTLALKYFSIYFESFRKSSVWKEDDYQMKRYKRTDRYDVNDLLGKHQEYLLFKSIFDWKLNEELSKEQKEIMEELNFSFYANIYSLDDNAL